MTRYVSLPRVRADVKKAIARVLKRAGLDGAIAVSRPHPERNGGKHRVTVDVALADLAAEEAN